MQKDLVQGESKMQRLIIFVGFICVGALIFLFGANTFELFSTNKNLSYEWGLTLILLALAAILRRSGPLRKYWKITYALFIASFANALNLYLGNWLADYLPAADSVAEKLAVDKLSQCIPIVLSIILLTWLAGDSLGSIFLQRGNLRQGLRFGLISFGVFAVLFVFIAILQSSGPASQGLWASGMSLDIIAAATYISPTQMLLFGGIVIALGLVNGWVMLKTDSIWGSVLFHAGYDLLIIIPVLASEL